MRFSLHISLIPLFYVAYFTIFIYLYVHVSIYILYAYIMNKNGSNYFNCVLNLLIDQCFVVVDGVAFLCHFILFFNSNFQSNFFFATDKMSCIKLVKYTYNGVVIAWGLCLCMYSFKCEVKRKS